MLLGSILTNIEVAYNLSQNEIETLEKCHEMGLRTLLNLSSKTPKIMLYFLTGSTPIRYIIKRRRLVYLHHILNQGEDTLLKTFFEQQLDTRKNKDWASQIIKDLEEYEIEVNMAEIRTIKEESWKSLIKENTQSIALNYLNSQVGSKSRKYKELKMSKFLCSENHDIPIETAKFIAKVQAHMVETIKINFQSNFKPNFRCDLCKMSECNQSHLLYCTKLIGSSELITYIPEYENIFDDNDPEEQLYMANILIDNLKRKKENGRKLVSYLLHVHLTAVCCCFISYGYNK